MIGRMVIFTFGRHTEKIIQRVWKITASTRSLVERLCDLKIYAVSVFSYIGSICAPDLASFKAEAHAFQCTAAGPYKAFSTCLLGVGSVCGLGLDPVGVCSISLVYVVWTTMASLMRCHRISSRRLEVFLLICLQQGHLVHPISTSNPFTFMTPGETCLIKWWKETKGGFCKGCSNVPHFVDYHSAARRLSQFCSLHISNIYAHKRCIANKLILTIRAIMIGQQIDVVADFNGTAWRCSNKYYRRSLCRLYCHRQALHHCGGPVRFQTTGLTSVDSLSRRVQIGVGKCACTVHSPFLAKLLVYVQPSKVVNLEFVDWRSTQSQHGENVLRRTSTTSRKGASAISWATIRSLHERATICTCTSPFAKFCTSSRSDLMTFFFRNQ